MRNRNITAIGYALAAALFYAVNVPCSKLLLEGVEPAFMAAFLYLGAGFGVGVMYLFRQRFGGRPETKVERLDKKDRPYTIGMVALDIAAPIFLMIGVNTATSSNVSLLGNFEIVATTVIALVLFGERVTKRLWTAIGLITLSSMILSFDGGGTLKFSLGSLSVIAATVCWGLENNCTRSISGKSTYQIVVIKGLGSGTGSLIIACILGEKLTGAWYVLCAMLLGFVSYGLSIFAYIRAQKALGAARTSAYYAVAPFIGVLLSFVLLQDRLSAAFMAALLIMLAGTAFVVCDTLKSDG